jgi:hypothetical protein
MYAIYRGRVYAPDQVPQSMAPRYEHAKSRVRQYHALETEGRIFPQSGARALQANRAQPAAGALSKPRPAP